MYFTICFKYFGFNEIKKKRNRLFGTTVAGIGVVTGTIAGWVGGFITGGFGW